MGKKSKKGGKKKGAAKKKSSLNRDDELLQAVTNSKLWQNKLVLVEKQVFVYLLVFINRCLA